jgi:hypothetical protein
MSVNTYDASTARPAAAEVRHEERSRPLSRAQWQRLLLPMMIGTVIAAMVAFLVFSLADTLAVRRRIESPPQLDLAGALARVNCDKAGTAGDVRLCVQWKVAALLEQHTIDRRYHMANVALLVRVSVKYLGFLTGMLMSLVGAVFVLGRLTESSSTVGAEGAFGKFTIATVSPGLIMAFLGTVLIIAAVFVNPPTDVNDGSVYLPAAEANR